jgi:hypothetical protein
MCRSLSIINSIVNLDTSDEVFYKEAIEDMRTWEPSQEHNKF